MTFDIAIIALVSMSAIALHVALFVLFRHWMDRDLALSFAGDEQAKRDYMLAQLVLAKAARVKRGELPGWLQRAAADYRAPGTAQAKA